MTKRLRRIIFYILLVFFLILVPIITFYALGYTFDFEKTKGAAPDATHRDKGGLITLRIFDSIKPVIAAINGPAVGIGITLTLAMDIRIASDSARFAFVFARRGVL